MLLPYDGKGGPPIHGGQMIDERSGLERRRPYNGSCDHCGMDWYHRCIPPRDYTQCGYYKEMIGRLAAEPSPTKEDK